MFKALHVKQAHLHNLNEIHYLTEVVVSNQLCPLTQTSLFNQTCKYLLINCARAPCQLHQALTTLPVHQSFSILSSNLNEPQSDRYMQAMTCSCKKCNALIKLALRLAFEFGGRSLGMKVGSPFSPVIHFNSPNNQHQSQSFKTTNN